MEEKIEKEDISVVVQGPTHKTRTKKCLESIRKVLPGAEIILSTWDDCNVDGLDYDILVQNEKPIAVQQKAFTSKKLMNNMNRMILSTNEGIKRATRKYILKLRTDSFIDNSKFLQMFDKFPARNEQYKLFGNRILASTLFSKIGTNGYKESVRLSFHLSDWWFFGLREDVEKLLLTSKLADEPYFSEYFEQPENQNKKSVFEKFSWRFAPEQYIGYSCFSKYFDDIRMEDCSDESDEINHKSELCLINNFIFLEYKQSGIRNQKYSYSKFEPFCGDQYLDLYTFYNFEKRYKKYCDDKYEITANPLFFAERKTGYRLLRFYKHWFKLFDQEATVLTKLEQIFIGIPFSGITLLPTLIKLLKERKQ